MATAGRAFLPEIAPGETAKLGLTITAPRCSGRFLLSVDVVEEGSVWFDPARRQGAAVTFVDIDPPLSGDGAAARGPALGAPHLVIDGMVRCGHVSLEELWFSVPASAQSVRLVSSTMAAAPPDIRTLGLLISQVAVESNGRIRELALDDPALSTGFYTIEGSGNQTWRWTNCNAVILPAAWADVGRDFVLRIKDIFNIFPLLFQHY